MTTYHTTDPTPFDSKYICTVKDSKGIVAYARRDSEEKAIEFGATLIVSKIKINRYERKIIK